jgi:hypothetical protein
VPDFSHFKFQALRAGNISIWEVTEHEASYNQTDVVKSMLFDTWVVVIYCNNDLSFFGFACLQLVLHDTTYARMALSAILDQATERLGYNWEYCTGNYGQQTTEGRQFYIRFTNGANGCLVGYIYGRPYLRSWEARESAIVRALSFIDSCGYIIHDIKHHEWLQMFTLVRRQQQPPPN